MKVFVSYFRRDEAAVRGMVRDLQRARIPVWLEDLGGGYAWWTQILEQIRECTVFLFALSDNSLNSIPCRVELGYAEDLGLPILPVQISEVSKYRADPIFSRQLIDYRNSTAATGFALMGALNDHAAHRTELPDPLPEEPPIPFAYLHRLSRIFIEPNSHRGFRPKSSAICAVRSTRSKSQPAKATAREASMTCCGAGVEASRPDHGRARARQCRCRSIPSLHQR